MTTTEVYELVAAGKLTPEQGADILIENSTPKWRKVLRAISLFFLSP